MAKTIKLQDQIVWNPETLTCAGIAGTHAKGTHGKWNCELTRRGGGEPVPMKGVANIELVTPPYGKSSKTLIANAWLNDSPNGKPQFKAILASGVKCQVLPSKRWIICSVDE